MLGFRVAPGAYDYVESERVMFSSRFKYKGQTGASVLVYYIMYGHIIVHEFMCFKSKNQLQRRTSEQEWHRMSLGK